jgi:phospholipid N-methyltransferase
VKKLKLYLETSIFGFYFDTSAPNKQKRIAVRKLLRQVKNGLFEGYVSGLVRAELEKAPRPYRERLLRLIDRYDLKAIEYDEDAAADLHEKYLRARVARGAPGDDAAHIAIATVGGVDVVVSCNLKHLANELASRRFLAVNILQGYSTSLSIRQPEEVIEYED